MALLRRVEEQAAFLSSPAGRRDIASGAARLRVVVGTSWREVLTPRGDGRAVQLPRAMRAGAIVLWRTWVEDLPDEAEAITALALADIVAAAAELRGETEWMVVLDEFGSVMEGNASRGALGVLGRARSSGGQAIVVTQSAADIPTATGMESLRESLDRQLQRLRRPPPDLGREPRVGREAGWARASSGSRPIAREAAGATRRAPARGGGCGSSWCARTGSGTWASARRTSGPPPARRPNW